MFIVLICLLYNKRSGWMKIVGFRIMNRVFLR